MFDGLQDTPKLVSFPQYSSNVLVQSSFTKQSCQWVTIWISFKGKNGSSIVFQCFGLRLGGSHIHTCVRSFLADTASLASPAILGGLAWKSYPGILLVPLASLMLHASRRLFLYPLSSLTLSPPGARLAPGMFWRCFASSECLRWQASKRNAT